MAIEIAERFSVAAPIERVWAFLTDPAAVAACLPGARLGETIDDRTFRGSISVKIGPVLSSYAGEARFEELDAAARLVVVVGRGTAAGGMGGAELRMTSHVKTGTGGLTEVEVSATVNLSGRVAQLGGRLVGDISHRLFEQFTACEKSRLEEAGAAGGAAPAAAPSSVNALAVVFRALVASLKRLFRFSR